MLMRISVGHDCRSGYCETAAQHHYNHIDSLTIKFICCHQKSEGFCNSSPLFGKHAPLHHAADNLLSVFMSHRLRGMWLEGLCLYREGQLLRMQVVKVAFPETAGGLDVIARHRNSVVCVAIVAGKTIMAAGTYDTPRHIGLLFLFVE